MNIEILNSGPSRDQPTFERSGEARSLVPTMTHGEACPIWMWLSDGYVESAAEKWVHTNEKRRKHKD